MTAPTPEVVSRLAEELRVRAMGGASVTVCRHHDIDDQPHDGPDRGCVIDAGDRNACDISVEGGASWSKDVCPYWKSMQAPQPVGATPEETLSLLAARSADQDRIRELEGALARLGSVEAFTVSRSIDKDRDAELLARIDYARASGSGEPSRLMAALAGFADDYMTSETHHPGYVLIPTEKFERIRAALHPHTKTEDR